MCSDLSSFKSERFHDKSRNDIILRREEDLDFFAILMRGRLFTRVEIRRLTTMEPGDMIGAMVLSDLTEQSKARYDIVAESEGLLAILPIGEIKLDLRKFP